MNTMDKATQAFLVIAAFAAVNERAIELIRKIEEKWPLSKEWIDRFTIGAFNVVPAVLLALLTQANLLALFRPVKLGNEPADFFDLYLLPPQLVWKQMEPVTFLHHAVGCVLMGFAISLGSQYWHDVGKGVIDLRDSLKSAGQKPSLPR